MPGPIGGDVGSVPMVGRDEEMAALRRWSAEAAGGRGRLVLCSGEAGVGKTRLAAAMADHARSVGAGTGWGHCLDGDGSVPFRPWLEALRPLVASQSSPPLGLEALLAEPAGREMPANGVGPSPSGELPDAQTRERAFDAVVLMLRAAGAAGGMLVVLDLVTRRCWSWLVCAYEPLPSSADPAPASRGPTPGGWPGPWHRVHPGGRDRVPDGRSPWRHREQPVINRAEPSCEREGSGARTVRGQATPARRRLPARR